MFMVFDTETDGLPEQYWRGNFSVDRLRGSENRWPHAIQIGWALYDGPTEIKARNLLVVPERPIPRESILIHGISNRRAKSEGHARHRVLMEFAEDLDQCDEMVAHNILFDLPVVGAEMLRAEKQSSNLTGMADVLMKPAHICTMTSTADLLKLPYPSGRPGYKWPKLEELHEYLFGAKFDDAHDALADVSATARCLLALRDRKLA